MSKTIMLVHGAWVTTDCWASFRDFFEAKGHRVIVPPWRISTGLQTSCVEVPIPALQR